MRSWIGLLPICTISRFALRGFEEGLAGVNRRLDRMEARIERIESRLELAN